MRRAAQLAARRAMRQHAPADALRCAGSAQLHAAATSAALLGEADAPQQPPNSSRALWGAAAASGAAAAGSVAWCDGAAEARGESDDAAAAVEVERSLEAARAALAAQLGALRRRWPDSSGSSVRVSAATRDGGRTAVLRVSLPPDADAAAALLAAAASLGAGGTPLRTRAHDTPAARQLWLCRDTSDTSADAGGADTAADSDSLALLVFAPRLAADNAALELEFSRRGPLGDADVAVVARTLAAAAAPPLQPPAKPDASASASTSAVDRLHALGATVYPARPAGAASSPHDDHPEDAQADADAADVAQWGELAGYEAQKRAVEETLLLALARPEVYDGIAARTRATFGRSRPRAVLLAGPPGTGKSSMARALSRRAAVTLVYLPLEAVQSKYYGEAERNLSAVFAACDALPGGCLLFLDEVDALAQRRGADMHEATRRCLSVLLRRLDSLESAGNTVLVAATNRPADLDPALLSRFDATVRFGLPDAAQRAAIAARYARHLAPRELRALAEATEGCAGRDLRDVAEAAERRRAAAIIRGTAPPDSLPQLGEYLHAAAERRAALALGTDAAAS